METKAIAESFDASTDDFMHQEKRLAERKLENGLIKVTSLIKFTSLLEPNSDAFHGLFSFNKIAITIPDTRASFLIWK